jgi:hypothetical protein
MGDFKVMEVIPTEEGLFVYGQQNDHTLIVIKFDKNLTEQYKYSKTFGKEIKNISLKEGKDGTYIIETCHNLRAEWDKCRISLNASLAETAFIEFNESSYASEKKINESYDPSPAEYSYSIGMSGHARYTLGWKTDLVASNIETIRKLYTDDKTVYMYINYEVSKKAFIQFMYCLDKKTGAEIYKVQLNTPDKNIYSPSRMALVEDKLIVVGNYAELSDDNKLRKYDRSGSGAFNGAYIVDMDGIFVMKIDPKQGTILKNQVYKYPNYVFANSDAFKSDHRFDVFHTLVSADKPGQVIAISENFFEKRVQSTFTSGTWAPVGFSVYKFDAEISLVEEKFIPKDKVIEQKGLTAEMQNLQSYSSRLNIFNTCPDYSVCGGRDGTFCSVYSFCKYVYDTKNLSMTILYQCAPPSDASNERIYYVATQDNMGEFKSTLLTGKLKTSFYLRDGQSAYRYTPPSGKNFATEFEIVKF